MWQVIVFLLLHALNETGATDSTTIIINTKSGPVKGRELSTHSGKKYLAFYGIPYALPPVRSLRFKPPLEVEPWIEVHDATIKPKACVQVVGPAVSHMKPTPWWREPPEDSSEDCLYLNVWMPNPRPKKAAVLVFIHGGGYYCGFSTYIRYDGASLAAEENLIVVSMNYRLSFFGFLYLDGENVTGNMGLLDQAMAINWVLENIEDFGGDPKKVTLMGHSAGSVSAGYQLSFMSRHNSVKRAILLSGTPSNSWSALSKEDASKSGLKLAKELNCVDNQTGVVFNSSLILRCLQRLEVDQLLDASMRVIEARHFVFAPVIDDTLVPRIATYQNVKEVMFGETTGDGAHQLSRHATDLLKRKLTNEELVEVVRGTIYEKDAGFKCQLIQLFYTNWTDPEDIHEMRRSLVRFATDTFMTCTTNEFADILVREGIKSYRFVFKHRPSTSQWPEWFKAAHGDEIQFVFGGVLDPNNGFNDEEKALAKRVMRVFANFVKTGNPNDDQDISDNLNWPPYSRKRMHFVLDLKEKIEANYRTTECAFWRNVVNLLSSTEVDSCYTKLKPKY